MYKKYIDFLISHKIFFLLLLGAINIFFIIGITKVRINPDFVLFTLRNSPAEAAFDRMTEMFKNTNQLSLLIEMDKKPATAAEFQKLRDIHLFFESLEGVTYVSSPAPAKIQLGRRTADFSSLTDEQIGLLYESFASRGEMNPVIEQDNSTFMVFTIFTAFTGGSSGEKKLFGQTSDYLKERNYTFFASGEIFLLKKIFDYVFILTFLLSGISFVLLFFFFRVNMGSFKAAFFSLIASVVGILWLIGTMGYLGIELSISTSIAPMFVFVMGSADGLHFVSHFYEDRCINRAMVPHALSATLEKVGIPMIMTTITTMAGFLSLLVIDSPDLNTLVLLSSAGIFFTAIATWLVLPLIFLRFNSCSGENRLVEFTVLKLKKVWGKPVLIGSVLLVLFSIPGILLTKNNFTLLSMFKKETAVRKNIENTRRITGNSLPLFITLQTKENPLLPETARRIEKLTAELKKEQLITGSVSIYTILALSNMTLYNKKKALYPDGKIQVEFLLTAFKKQAAGLVSGLFVREKNAARIVLFPRDFKNDTINRIEQTMLGFHSDEFRLELAGFQYTFTEMNGSIVAKQQYTLLCAFLLVFGLLFISYRKPVPALLSLVPIVMTVLVMFGFMGFAGIPVSSFISIITGIAIGVGIDYSIHFTSIFLYYKKAGAHSHQASSHALRYAARPIIINALGIAFGLSVLLFSPLTFHLHLSLIIWVTMGVSSILSLTLLPTLLKMFYKA